MQLHSAARSLWWERGRVHLDCFSLPEPQGSPRTGLAWVRRMVLQSVSNNPKKKKKALTDLSDFWSAYFQPYPPSHHPLPSSTTSSELLHHLNIWAFRTTLRFCPTRETEFLPSVSLEKRSMLRSALRKWIHEVAKRWVTITVKQGAEPHIVWVKRTLSQEPLPSTHILSLFFSKLVEAKVNNQQNTLHFTQEQDIVILGQILALWQWFTPKEGPATRFSPSPSHCSLNTAVCMRFIQV